MIMDIHQSTGHGIRRICAVLGVPRSSYYHAAEPTATQRSDQEAGDEIEKIFRHHRRRYGYRRIGAELADRDMVCAPARVRRIMKERGLKADQPKNYVPRTSDGRADQPSPNLLLGQPLPLQPDRVWAGDITFIPTSSGWLYLAVVIDLFSRRIVGWALADHLRATLVMDALAQAPGSRRESPRPDLSQRPRQPVWQRALPPAFDPGRPASKHVRPRQSLSQCLDRVLHGHFERRDASGRLLCQCCGRPSGDLLLH